MTTRLKRPAGRNFETKVICIKFVVDFDQHLGAKGITCWLKSAFSHFKQVFDAKMIKNQGKMRGFELIR